MRFWPGLLRPIASVCTIGTGVNMARTVWRWSLHGSLPVYCLPYLLSHGLMTVLIRKWELYSRQKFLSGLQDVNTAAIAHRSPAAA
jgi:hypothetical protein